MWRYAYSFGVRGYRTAYAPAGALVHHEGATRGHSNPTEDVQRLADDIRALGIDEDPYLYPDLDGKEATPTLRPPGRGGACRDVEAYDRRDRFLRTHADRLGSIPGWACWRWSGSREDRCCGHRNQLTKSWIAGARLDGHLICCADVQICIASSKRGIGSYDG
jgi:hypothetical protein